MGFSATQASISSKALREEWCAERGTAELVAAYEKPFEGLTAALRISGRARALRTGGLASQMDRIERLTIPTMVLCGGEDQFRPLRHGERLARAMPNARFETVAAAGHFLPEDASEELASKIAEFMRE